MLELIMPMAGLGKRFKDSKITTPKPLILVQGKPLFLWALESIKNSGLNIRVNIVVLKSESIRETILSYAEDFNTRIMQLDHPTQGPAHTVFQSLEHFKINSSFISLDCDLSFSCGAMNAFLPNFPGDGFLLTFPSILDRFSYVDVENGRAKEIREKKVISSTAVAGCYGFSSAADFKKYFLKIESTNEIYISHVIQKMLEAGKNFSVFNSDEYLSLGTPQEIGSRFENFQSI